ncbi:50S ribosomal protein L6 [Candidatus Amesbacteria bacterium RIFCSPHIGHO2_01_FULL_48_32]|uniref:50S ribosomal protein L6 n=1 Tax=Candidatus Amesbacteria bacterium RIFCSPLOWO2_01_FULL_48_25 TaxID=1797259 RepID=A0A1F4ZAS7_9BACT|nr:MAG: 50S ribosomal protein L6 [Candidatus Amesbacteria bacterium RIFCSPHIGHO2_01_FULL_48_32]OGD03322.1 MAG: 50S ribosomal protein L6 [Candidatus Amesbacteria bacterium RIFCSPLOWO2_01_FULL_48_25]HJZ05271.1 50S ribosomal protein L6 [Patescibacteria group bacterium]
MSKIAKKVIPVPSGVAVSVSDRTVRVVGPKGELTMGLPAQVEVLVEGNIINTTYDEGASHLAGLTRSTIANMTYGVTTGWSKVLELSGTGYRAAATNEQLTLNLGFSHPVIMVAPGGIAFEVKENKITVLGADKILVGGVAAKIRNLRPADPYKAKGLKYEGEVIVRKAGKAAKAAAGATK